MSVLLDTRLTFFVRMESPMLGMSIIVQEKEKERRFDTLYASIFLEGTVGCWMLRRDEGKRGTPLFNSGCLLTRDDVNPPFLSCKQKDVFVAKLLRIRSQLNNVHLAGFHRVFRTSTF